MHRLKLVPIFLGMVVLAATVALKLVGGSDAAVNAQLAVSQTMHAVVHQNNDIFLTFDDGSAVGNQDRTPPTIPAGTYTIRVVDDTAEHNFHLVGPGVDMLTGTGDLQSPTWVVTLTNGTYRFVCDNHSDFMFGLFSVSGTAGGGSSGGGSSGGGTSGGGSSGGGSSGGGSSGGGSSGGGSSTSGGGKTVPKTVGAGSVLGTLAGTVNAKGKLTLLYKGKAVSKLKAGKYKVTVVDKTAARSFLVQQAKHKAVTISGVSFVGKKTATLTLKAGKWSFFTSAGPASKSSFTVS
jgi:hypothetical protein